MKSVGVGLRVAGLLILFQCLFFLFFLFFFFRRSDPSFRFDLLPSVVGSAFVSVMIGALAGSLTFFSEGKAKRSDAPWDVRFERSPLVRGTLHYGPATVVLVVFIPALFLSSMDHWMILSEVLAGNLTISRYLSINSIHLPTFVCAVVLYASIRTVWDGKRRPPVTFEAFARHINWGFVILGAVWLIHLQWVQGLIHKH